MRVCVQSLYFSFKVILYNSSEKRLLIVYKVIFAGWVWLFVIQGFPINEMKFVHLLLGYCILTGKPLIKVLIFLVLFTTKDSKDGGLPNIGVLGN